MNARAAFKIAVTVVVLLLGLGAIALVCTWAYQKYGQVLAPMPAQGGIDSAKVYREKAAIHFDSSQFYYRKYETHTQHADSVSTDSAAFAHLVAEYSANLRRTIEAEIRDSIARQRGEIRADQTAHGDASKKLRFHPAGEPGPEK